MQNVLITGVSRGIAFEIALQLLKKQNFNMLYFI